MSAALPPFADLVGVPYRPGGRNPAEGLDCWGLVLELYRRKGVALPDPRYADTDSAAKRRAADSLAAAIPNIPLAEPEPGCVAEFTVLGEPSHAGVCLGNGLFIHASRSAGVAVDRIRRWKNRVRGFYRILEEEKP